MGLAPVRDMCCCSQLGPASTPAALIKVSERTSAGQVAARCSAIAPPIELATTCTRPTVNWHSSSLMRAAWAAML